MTGFWIVVVTAILSFGFFVFATVELAALVAGRRAVPASLRRLAPEALGATGIVRLLGTIFSFAIAIGTQFLALDLLLGRTNELNTPDVAVLIVELAGAVSWTVFMLER